MSQKNILVCILLVLILAALKVEALPYNVNTSEGLNTSFYCMECHEARYKEWTSTMHALAINDPIFRSSYIKAILYDSRYRELCLGCHSPLTKITKDFNLSKSISVEGVTCNFCHSVKSLEKNNYTIDMSGTMYGPYNNSFSTKHSSNYSEILTRSEFCAGCHEFSLNGIPISETYSEWKEGPYSKEGKQCQDCHMEALPGYSSNDIRRDNVYRHFWYGGHSGQFLEKAFNVEYNIKKEGKKAILILNITNKGVGHKIPSGFPSRQVILKVTVTDKGRDIYDGKKIYTKTITDQYGNEVYDFWKATSITGDNRIKPRETRIETFEFDIPENASDLEVHTNLRYGLEAEIIQTYMETVNVELIDKKDIISLDNMTIRPKIEEQTVSNNKFHEEIISNELNRVGIISPGVSTIIAVVATIMVVITVILILRRNRYK